MHNRQATYSNCLASQMVKVFEDANSWECLFRHYGSSSTIYVCRKHRLSMNSNEQLKYALKTITLPPSSNIKQYGARTQLSLKFKELRQIKSEIIALQKLQRYCSIIRIYQVIFQKDSANQESFLSHFFHAFLNIKSKNCTNICMILEYCSQGTLEQYLKIKKIIFQSQIIDIGLKILSCIAAMREQRILHRDLRPINILICQQGLKLCDFDISFIEGFSMFNDLYRPIVQRVVAPQIKTLIKNNEQFYMNLTSQQIYEALQYSDLYSFGVMLFEMASGQTFQKHTYELKLQSIQTKCSLQLVFIIKGLLLQDPKQRLKIYSISNMQCNLLKCCHSEDFVECNFDLNQIDREDIQQITQQEYCSSNSISISDWSVQNQSSGSSKQFNSTKVVQMQNNTKQQNSTD